MLSAVAKIPRGKVLTYKQVAELAGRPKAWRAVGNILNKNFNSEIPCYRVIRSDGKLGGYNRGKKLKERLLKKENVSGIFIGDSFYFNKEDNYGEKADR